MAIQLFMASVFFSFDVWNGPARTIKACATCCVYDRRSVDVDGKQWHSKQSGTEEAEIIKSHNFATSLKWPIFKPTALRSASSLSLIVGCTRLSTVVDRAFPVALPLLMSGTINLSTVACHFCTLRCLFSGRASRLKHVTQALHHFLSQSLTMYSARAVTLVILNILIVHVTYLFTYLLKCEVHLPRDSGSYRIRFAGWTSSFSCIEKTNKLQCHVI